MKIKSEDKQNIFLDLYDNKHKVKIRNKYHVGIHNEDQVGGREFRMLPIEKLDYSYDGPKPCSIIIRVSLDDKVDNILHTRNVIEKAFEDHYIILDNALSCNNLNVEDYELFKADLHYCGEIVYLRKGLL